MPELPSPSAGPAPAGRTPAPRPERDAAGPVCCDRCGAGMFRMRAVWRCARCGFKTDCCGW